MDVGLCLECWLQVVMDNGLEESYAKEIRFRILVLEKKWGEYCGTMVLYALMICHLY